MASVDVGSSVEVVLATLAILVSGVALMCSGGTSVQEDSAAQYSTPRTVTATVPADQPNRSDTGNVTGISDPSIGRFSGAAQSSTT